MLTRAMEWIRKIRARASGRNGLPLHRSLRGKLLLWFLILSLIPMMAGGAISYLRARDALIKDTQSKLAAVRSLKASQVSDLFIFRLNKIQALANVIALLRDSSSDRLAALAQIRKTEVERYFENAFKSLETHSESYPVKTLYRKLDAHLRDNENRLLPDSGEFEKLTSLFGYPLDKVAASNHYQDLLLVHMDTGLVAYSVMRGEELGRDLTNGQFRDSGLARLARRVAESKGTAFSDFQRIGEDEKGATAYMGAPVFDNDDNLVGMLAAKITVQDINAIMQSREGLGKTGEAYLVGPDFRMRSDSIQDPVGHSVKASFAGTIDENGMKTPAAREALRGAAGSGIRESYRDHLVITAWEPVRIQNVTWAAVTEMDLEEAFHAGTEGQQDFLARFATTNMYEDLYLIDTAGYVFYSKKQAADYHENVLTGSLADTHLGRLVQKVKDTQFATLSDLDSYEPSGGQVVGFAAAPVLREMKTSLIVAVQFTPDYINMVMSREIGGASDVLGETLDTVLVGPDYRMRSDSRLASDTHTITASFAGSVKDNGIRAEYVERALSENPEENTGLWS
ncbi:MAG: cache domain-containing protein, partial [Desulfatibacillaceae bacterium]